MPQFLVMHVSALEQLNFWKRTVCISFLRSVMKTRVGVRGRMATAGVRIALAPGQANRARVEGEEDPGP